MFYLAHVHGKRPGKLKLISTGLPQERGVCVCVTGQKLNGDIMTNNTGSPGKPWLGQMGV